MKQTILSYRTIIKPDGKYYHGYVPTLSGCHTQGKTIEETQRNLREAITGYLQTLANMGEPIPTESGVETTEIFDVKKIFTGRKRISYA